MDRQYGRLRQAANKYILEPFLVEIVNMSLQNVFTQNSEEGLKDLYSVHTYTFSTYPSVDSG